MTAAPDDTIVALASGPGPGERAIIRVSGPRAHAVVAALVHSEDTFNGTARHLFSGEVQLAGVHSPLPVEVYFWPAPRTYTGQALCELHTVSCPPLVELLIQAILNAGARAAQPGEFTMRAFLAGKLDLTRAEAVLGVIEAGDRTELKHALKQLAGGVSRPLQELRDDLLNLLADVEAGLDFSDEDISFVDDKEMLLRLGKGLAQLALLQKQLTERSTSESLFRVVLTGRPNAGKSSLFNALAGASAIVSPVPGTTRDYLTTRVNVDGVALELVDTPGWQAAGDNIEEQAQSLRREQAERADLVLLCVPARESLAEEDRRLLGEGQPPVLLVTTQADRAPGCVQTALSTSVVTGQGIAELKRVLAEQVRNRRQPALAPSLSRCRHHVEAALDCLRRAHSIVLDGDPPEILALEVRGAIEQIGAMAGTVYTDDLLDRIFSRFCIGK